MAEDHTIEESGLLDGLAGPARAERAELVDWLLTKGVSVEQIRSAVSPTLLVSRRIFGDDGELVSVRDVAERADLDLALTERLLRAIGLPHTDSPDERVYLTLSGRAEVVTDHAAAAGMWRPAFKRWFPGGPGDPRLLVVRFATYDADYYQTSGGRVSSHVGA